MDFVSFQYDSDSDSDGESKKINKVEIYEEILKIVHEGESIGKAIRRLGKNRSKIPSASQRWKVPRTFFRDFRFCVVENIGLISAL